MNKIISTLILSVLFLSGCHPDESNQYSITGLVGYDTSFFNDIVPEATVNLIENDQIIASSAIINGHFSFEHLIEGKTYTIMPDIPPSLNSSHNGISTIDWLRVKDYIDGTGSLTPFQITAADVNKDGMVDQTDLEEIQNCIVGQTICPGWRFVTEDYNGSGKGGIDMVTLPHLMANKDIHFIPLKLGDIN